MSSVFLTCLYQRDNLISKGSEVMPKKKKNGGVLGRSVPDFLVKDGVKMHPFDTPITPEDRRLAELHLKLRRA